MKLEFWGTRGSLAVPSGKTPKGIKRKTDKYGGNSTCVRILSRKGSQHIIDAGTGIKNLGDYLENKYSKDGLKIDIYFTHTHWDHIQGLPFFKPAYNERFDITLHAQKKDEYDVGEALKEELTSARGIKQIISRQHEEKNFPAPPTTLKGIKKFVDFKPKDVIRNHDLIIDTLELNHPGGCITYKFSEFAEDQEDKADDGHGKFKSLVFSTDFETDDGLKDKLLKEFIKDVDLWVADGQYEIDSEVNKHFKGCGHSDPFKLIDYAIESCVKILVITHHSPKMDDRYHDDLQKRLQRYAKEKSGMDEKKNITSFKVALAKEGDIYEI